ncbi:MAG: hypothetical protein RJA87_368 [Pseudomonadota bacterium]|jgi:hypothetical protein
MRGRVNLSPSPNPLPQGGEGFFCLSPLPVGEGLSEGLSPLNPAFPAQAGIQNLTYRLELTIWTPAFAGDAVEGERH